jgi:hypothetical protein
MFTSPLGTPRSQREKEEVDRSASIQSDNKSRLGLGRGHERRELERTQYPMHVLYGSTSFASRFEREID